MSGKENDPRSRLTPEGAGSYTKDMSGEGGQDNGPKLRVNIVRRDGTEVPLAPRRVDSQTEIARLRGQLQYEQMMRSAAEQQLTTPDPRPVSPEPPPPIQASTVTEQAAAPVVTPPVARAVVPGEVVVTEAEEDTIDIPGIEEAEEDLDEWLNEPVPPGPEIGERGKNHEVIAIETLVKEIILADEVTPQTIQCARALKRWVNTLIVNIEKEKEDPGEGLSLIGNKEAILSAYKNIDFDELVDRTPPDQQLRVLQGAVAQLVRLDRIPVSRDRQGGIVLSQRDDPTGLQLDIRDYFKDLPPEAVKKSRNDYIPSNAEEFLRVIGDGINKELFGVGGKYELVDIEGNINYYNMFVLFRERSNALSGNNPTSTYNFLTEVTIQIANFEMNINRIIGTAVSQRLYTKRSTQITGSEREGEVGRYNAEYVTNVDTRMKKIVDFAAYLDAYPAQLAHGRDRAQYPGLFGKGWEGMGSVAGMFNGDMQEDRIRSMFCLPASDDPAEINGFVDRQVTGTVGNAVRKGYVAMKYLLEGFPPTGDEFSHPTVNMLDKVLSWQKDPTDIRPESDGAHEYYKSLTLGMINLIGKDEYAGYVENVIDTTIRSLYEDKYNETEITINGRQTHQRVPPPELAKLLKHLRTRYESGAVAYGFDIPAQVIALVHDIEGVPSLRKGHDDVLVRDTTLRRVVSGFSTMGLRRVSVDDGNEDNAHQDSFAKLMRDKASRNIAELISSLPQAEQVLYYQDPREFMNSTTMVRELKNNLNNLRRAERLFSDENGMIEITRGLFGGEKEAAKAAYKKMLSGLTGSMAIGYDDLNMFNDPGKPEEIKNLQLDALGIGACAGWGKELNNIDRAHVKTIVTNLRHWTGVNARNEYIALGNDPWSNLFHLGRHITERLRNGQRRFVANFYNDDLFNAYRFTFFDGLEVARQAGSGSVPVYTESVMSAIQGGAGTKVDFNKPMHNIVLKGKIAETKFGGALASMTKLAQTIITKGDIDVSEYIKLDGRGQEVLDHKGEELLLSIEGEGRGALSTHFGDPIWNELVYGGEFYTEKDEYGIPVRDHHGKIKQTFEYREQTREQETFGTSYFDIKAMEPKLSRFRLVQLAMLVNSFKLHRTPGTHLPYWDTDKVGLAAKVLEYSHILHADQFKKLVDKNVLEKIPGQSDTENLAGTVSSTMISIIWHVFLEIVKAGLSGAS